MFCYTWISFNFFQYHLEYSDSGDEADLEEPNNVDFLFPSAVKWRFRSKTQFDLPETVTVLETSHGSKVFVVGTAHFSKESQEDVAAVKISSSYLFAKL